MSTFSRIVVATDLAAPSAAAVDMAMRLARDEGAQLTLVHTFEVPVWAYAPYAMYGGGDLVAPVESAAQEALARELTRVRAVLPVATSVFRRGIPAVEIVAAAREANADLLVIGTHGRTGIDHLVLGSVAERVVRTSPLPVLTVKWPSAC